MKVQQLLLCANENFFFNSTEIPVSAAVHEIQLFTITIIATCCHVNQLSYYGHCLYATVWCECISHAHSFIQWF